MVDKIAELLENTNSLLILGPAGSGKTTLAVDLSLQKAKEGKKIFFITLIPSSNIVNGVKKLFPEISDFMGKSFFFGYVEPESDNDLLADVEHVVKTFKPEILVIDPLYPNMESFVFKEICDTLKINGISGIFCGNEEHLESLVDFVLEIKVEKIKDKVRREIVVKSRAATKEKRFSFSISENGVMIEEE